MSAADLEVETTARLDFEVWSTTATLVVTDAAALATAGARLREVLAEVDATCSRFRDDSEINRLLRRPGHPVGLSPTLNDALGHALRAASATGGLGDPTVAAAVVAVGYDRDIADVLDRALTGTLLPLGSDLGPAVPGAGCVHQDQDAATVTVPAGVGLDLGATAKAFAADRAATAIANQVGGGVLVGLGGDIAVAGTAPVGGWRISVADDHRLPGTAYQTVAIESGGLATSSIMTRRWPTARGWRHHLIDPRTGDNPDPYWRTASVAAATCVDANAAATAAIILGAVAPTWLDERGLPALLVDIDGRITTVAGWPAAAEH
jgi:thiamine biosynthesis lipoprotein